MKRIIMESITLITSKKYKTLGELLKAPIKSIILVSSIHIISSICIALLFHRTI